MITNNILDDIDPDIGDVEAMYRYFYFLAPGISITRLKDLEEQELFKRFDVHWNGKYYILLIDWMNAPWKVNF